MLRAKSGYDGNVYWNQVWSKSSLSLEGSCVIDIRPNAENRLNEILLSSAPGQFRLFLFWINACKLERIHFKHEHHESLNMERFLTKQLKTTACRYLSIYSTLLIFKINRLFWNWYWLKLNSVQFCLIG